jgi:hypothetical protein
VHLPFCIDVHQTGYGRVSYDRVCCGLASTDLVLPAEMTHFAATKELFATKGSLRWGSLLCRYIDGYPPCADGSFHIDSLFFPSKSSHKVTLPSETSSQKILNVQTIRMSAVIQINREMTERLQKLELELDIVLTLGPRNGLTDSQRKWITLAERYQKRLQTLLPQDNTLG